jgi:tetratricopeptide (TPR) repeat protein
MTARIVLAAVVICMAALGQLRTKLDVNPETPEGKALQQIDQERDEAAKLQRGEQFLAKSPGHRGAIWVYGVLQPLYLKAKQYDKALAAGEKILAADPEDAEVGHHTLQAAEGGKDPDLILKWSDRTSAIARKAAAAPRPQAAEAAAAWEFAVDYVRQLDIYTEYSLYRALLETPDPRKKIMLGEALEKRNPKSQYIPQMAGPWIAAYQGTGDSAKAAALAESTLARDPKNETALLTLADAAYNSKQYDKSAEYGEKLASSMSDITAAMGNWYAGMSFAAEGKWAQADKSLRAAIPLLKGNAALLPAALFQAGLANHNMKKMTDAAGFFEQCAKIESPYQAQAQKNLKAIRGK